jgi:hypothetical protein
VSFSYDPTLADGVSQVRNLLGDTVEPARWTDAQLTYYLNAAGSQPNEAAALALETLATRYATVPDVQLGSKRMSGSQVYDRLIKHAAVLRAGGMSAVGAVPYAAGLSYAEAELDWMDMDLPRPHSGTYDPDVYPFGRRYGGEVDDW